MFKIMFKSIPQLRDSIKLKTRVIDEYRLDALNDNRSLMRAHERERKRVQVESSWSNDCRKAVADIRKLDKAGCLTAGKDGNAPDTVYQHLLSELRNQVSKLETGKRNGAS